MSFKGFSAPNQHTQTPNEFFEIMFDKKTKFGEVKLLGFLIRNTFGWHRAGNSLQFSFSDLQRETGMSRDTTNTSIKSCLEKGYIQKNEIDGKMYYRLNILDFQDYPWDVSFDWRKVSTKTSPKIEPVRKSNQSENQTSPKIVPEVVRKSDQYQSENRTTSNAESLEPQEVEPSLNKGLNKGLNKKREEEEYNKRLQNYRARQISSSKGKLEKVTKFPSPVCEEIATKLYDEKNLKVELMVAKGAFEKYKKNKKHVGNLVLWFITTYCNESIASNIEEDETIFEDSPTVPLYNWVEADVK
jgi:hypothetical protein